MKRTLEVFSLVLILVGIELATGAVSYSLGRLERVYRALRTGNEPEVSLVSFAMGTLAVILGGVILSLTIWARFGARVISAGTTCPLCGGDTTRIHRRWHHRLLELILGTPISRRRCSGCGWRGLTTLT